MIEIMFSTFLVLILLRVPISISLGVSSTAAIYFGSHIPMMILPQKVFGGLNSFPYLSIPLFLLAGNIMAEAKISEKLIGLASVLVKNSNSGLAQISTLSSAFFGAISGSSPATTAAIGTLMIPEMKRNGYEPRVAGAVVASSGALGLIIPPSLTMVVYGVISGTSIGSLFIAGIIPGILICGALILIQKSIIKPSGIIDLSKERKKFEFDGLALLAIFMPIIIIGGIYSGAFTATESAAIACAYGLIVGIFIYRSVTLNGLYKIFKITIENTAIVMFLMAMANLFGFVITAEKVPQLVADQLLNITDNKIAILFLIMVFLLIVGTFLDNVTALLLVVPTLVSVITKVDIDPVFFGVFTVIALSVGQFTPPVGLNLLISASLAECKIESISKSVIPYIFAYIAILSLIIFIPSLVTILV